MQIVSRGRWRRSISHTFIAIAGIGFGVTFGLSASADTGASSDASGATTNSQSPSLIDQVTQARIAESILKLERAFSEQFVNGTVDREALSGLVNDVLTQIPEDQRDEVQASIDEVIRTGEEAISRMSRAEREELAKAAEHVDQTQQAYWPRWRGSGGSGSWGGWSGWGGWGIGAFQFPGYWSGHAGRRWWWW